MSERNKCNLCGGFLFSAWYEKKGVQRLRSACLSCGYRFNDGKILQLTLSEVNELRLEKGLKPRKNLRKRRK